MITWRQSLEAAIANLETREKVIKNSPFLSLDQRSSASQSLRFAAERFREVLDEPPHRAREALEKLKGAPL